MQINESDMSEKGTLNSTALADRTDFWYRHLEVALQALEISGLTETIRQAVVMPEEVLRALPPPARLLQVLREIPEAFSLTASAYEDDTEAALTDLLALVGFTAAQMEELHLHRIRWPLMSEEKEVSSLHNSPSDEVNRIPEKKN